VARLAWGDRQVDEFGDAHAGLDRDEQHRVVAAPDPCGSVRRREQRVDLAAVEIGDGGLAVACGGDLEHPGDACCVLGVAQRGVAEQRVDRREPGVACRDAVPALALEVDPDAPISGASTSARSRRLGGFAFRRLHLALASGNPEETNRCSCVALLVHG
jgi:hypothetical protein